MCCREEVEDFFDKMDRDYDGRLSFEEFMGEESTIGRNPQNNAMRSIQLVTQGMLSFQHYYRFGEPKLLT
jgi:hypothetical protein